MTSRRSNCVFWKAAALSLAGSLALTVAGCARSEPAEDVIAPPAGAAAGGTSGRSSTDGGAGGARARDGGSGSGGAAGGGPAGAPGRGGGVGTGGAVGSGGHSGGSGGSIGGRSGSAGSSGSGGSGASGASGRGGNAGGGGTAGKSGGGPAPTFTQIYTTILIPSCSGGQCHNPGSQHGVAFATKALAYQTLLRLAVTPGDAVGSSLYFLVASGAMPAGKPMLSSTLLDQIGAWIDAGALNN